MENRHENGLFLYPYVYPTIHVLSRHHYLIDIINYLH